MTCKEIFLVEYLYIKKYLLPMLVLITLTCIVFFMSVPKAVTNQIKGVAPVSVGVELPADFIVDNAHLFSLFTTSPMIKQVQLLENKSSDDDYDIKVTLPDNLEEIIYEGEGGKVKVAIKDSRIGHFMLPMIRQGMDMLLIYQGNSLKLSHLLLSSNLPEEDKDKLMTNFNESLIAQLIFRNNYLKKEVAQPRYLTTLISILIFIWVVSVSFFSQVILMNQTTSHLLKKMKMNQTSLIKVLGIKLGINSFINLMGITLLFVGLSRGDRQIQFFPLLGQVVLLGVTLSLFLFMLIQLGIQFGLITEVLTFSGSLIFVWLLLSGLIYPLTSQLNWLQLANPATYLNSVVISSFQGGSVSVMAIFFMVLVSLICTKGCCMLWKR